MSTQVNLPPFDISSLETLVASLSSTDDAEVLTALAGLCKQVQEVRLESGSSLWRIGIESIRLFCWLRAPWSVKQPPARHFALALDPELAVSTP